MKKNEKKKNDWINIYEKKNWHESVWKNKWW